MREIISLSKHVPPVQFFSCFPLTFPQRRNLGIVFLLYFYQDCEIHFEICPLYPWCPIFTLSYTLSFVQPLVNNLCRHIW